MLKRVFILLGCFSMANLNSLLVSLLYSLNNHFLKTNHRARTPRLELAPRELETHLDYHCCKQGNITVVTGKLASCGRKLTQSNQTCSHTD